MDRIVLMKNAATADEVHIKYIHRRQSPTIAGLPAKLNSAQLRRQAGGQCLGQNLCVGENVHICRTVVSGRAGGFAPGMSAASENQATERLRATRKYLLVVSTT